MLSYNLTKLTIRDGVYWIECPPLTEEARIGFPVTSVPYYFFLSTFSQVIKTREKKIVKPHYVWKWMWKRGTIEIEKLYFLIPRNKKKKKTEQKLWEM